MMHWHRTGLLKDGKVSNTATRGMSPSACHWSSKTGTRDQHKQWMCLGKNLSVATSTRKTNFYLEAKLADHPELDKFTCAHGKFYCILSNIGNIM